MRFAPFDSSRLSGTVHSASGLAVGGGVQAAGFCVLRLCLALLAAISGYARKGHSRDLM